MQRTPWPETRNFNTGAYRQSSVGILVTEPLAPIQSQNRGAKGSMIRLYFPLNGKNEAPVERLAAFSRGLHR